MVFVVCFLQVIFDQVGVDFRGFQLHVPQDALDVSQIDTGI